MKTVLFFTHTQKECGIHAYGKATGDALSLSTKYRFRYWEVPGPDSFCQAIRDQKAEGDLAAVIFNLGAPAMSWLSNDALNWLNRKMGIPTAELVHDQCCAHSEMRWHIHIDPTHPECNEHFSVGRPVPTYDKPANPPKEFTIGAFGFAFRSHTHLINLVQEQFDECVVRLHIPYAHFGDVDGKQAHHQANLCREALKKPGIRLEITHDFKPQGELLDWLASNSLNAFIYDVNYGRGPSSTVDMALAVPVPIALNRSWQFRHIPETWLNRIEHWSLREIHDMWPPARFQGQWKCPWGPTALVKDYERIVDAMVGAK